MSTSHELLNQRLGLLDANYSGEDTPVPPPTPECLVSSAWGRPGLTRAGGQVWGSRAEPCGPPCWDTLTQDSPTQSSSVQNVSNSEGETPRHALVPACREGGQPIPLPAHKPGTSLSCSLVRLKDILLSSVCEWPGGLASGVGNRGPG